MNSIKVMVNGIPGNMAQAVTKQVLKDERFTLVPYSLTGPEIAAAEHVTESDSVKLIQPGSRKEILPAIINEYGNFISVDFTHPTAVNDNAEFYCRHQLPFVMGTTGGNRELLEEVVSASRIPAVIAPNMAKQIVGFQAMIEYAADTFPGLFDGYCLRISESHQRGKADTSGTAKAMVRYFNALGTPYREEDILKERDPENQRSHWKIPPEYIGGHAWHTYTLDSSDGTVRFEFTHNVNGRDIYARGTLDAVVFLYDKVKANVGGKVFSMIDVLRRI